MVFASDRDGGLKHTDARGNAGRRRQEIFPRSNPGQEFTLSGAANLLLKILFLQ
jgi:hypothetical protein